MTVAAENTVKRKAVEQFRAAEKHLALLELEMAIIGKEWISFGEALQRPSDYAFDVTETAIELSKPNGGLGVHLGRLMPAKVSWGHFCRLLLDHRNTVREKAELEAKLAKAHYGRHQEREPGSDTF